MLSLQKYFLMKIFFNFLTREIDLSNQLEKTQVEASEAKDRLQRRIVVRIILIYMI